MTTIVVLADPPRPGLSLPEIAATTPLDPTEAADLYAGLLADVLRAGAAAGGDLLVNYRTEATIPDEYAESERRSDESEDTGENAENAENAERAKAAVCALAAESLHDPAEARYEPQVGSTPAARVGNTVTHLLEAEDATSVIVVDATTPFLMRSDLDGAAMKLRRSPVVIGPGSRGRVAYAGFGETIDFADADTPPAIGTLTDRALDAGHEVEYVPMEPILETGGDLQTTLATLDARRRAGRSYPERTATTLDALGVTLVAEDGDLVVSKA